MRSFSWEIFVGSILLFFVALLLSNEKDTDERREAGQDGMENIFSETQNLESKIEQKDREIEQKIKENTTGRLSPSQALQTMPNQSMIGI